MNDLATSQTVSEDRPKNANALVSLVIAAPDGTSGHEEAIIRLAAHLSQRFSFFELVLLLSERDDAAIKLMQLLINVAPQTRLLIVDRALGFDDLAIYGYEECIGDVIVMTVIEEAPFIDLDVLISPILAGARLVRVRRPNNSLSGWLSSRLVRVITGFRVDTRFFKTLALNRQLLTELLAAPESLTLFRFTVGKRLPGRTVVVIDGPRLRGGVREGLRRIDLAARLITTAAPRLLRYAGSACATLSVAAFLALFYVIGVWLLKRNVVEGWTTQTSLLAIWMSAQLGAMSILCLGLSRLLDQIPRHAKGSIIDEISVGDLFGNAQFLNVERADSAYSRKLDETERVHGTGNCGHQSKETA